MSVWVYQQSTGRLLDPEGNLAGVGYAGHGDGVNNPAMQDLHMVGPLPQGNYTVQAPVDHTTLGEYALPLLPYRDNTMFGRSGFYLHGDEISNPGQRLASDGCIIMARAVRETVFNSTDHVLEVVSGEQYDDFSGTSD